MSAHFVTVDVGGTKILAAAVAENGTVLARHKEKTDRESRKKITLQIHGAIDTVVQNAGLMTSGIAGIALGIPGVVDSAAGHVIFTPNAPLTDTPLARTTAERFAVPVVVGNDVNFGTLGEFTFGAAREASSAFGVFVGTGIGGGLVIDGKLIEGFRGLGGEIGHLMIPLGTDEIVGALERKHLFLEDLCSRTAIENQLRHAIQVEGKSSALTGIVGDQKLKRIRSRALREALRAKDPLVTEVVRRASYLLGLATASVLHIVDPEVIVFGGGVIEACGDWMLPWIEKTAHKVAMPGTGARMKIVRSELGDDAIVLGGLALLKRRSAQTPTGAISSAGGDRRDRSQPLAQVDKPLQSA